MQPNYNRKFSSQTQQFLLPVDMNDWLKPTDDAVIYRTLLDQMDLGRFYEKYRTDGHGGKFIDPKHTLGVLIYCYSHNLFSSREMEKACRLDVGCRYLCGNISIDHATIARFRRSNLEAINDLFTQFLVILYEAKFLDSRILSLDGTKIEANASLSANQTYERLGTIAHRLVHKAESVDSEEDNPPSHETKKEALNREEMINRVNMAREIVETRHKAEIEAYNVKKSQQEEKENETGKKNRGRKLIPPSPEPDQSQKANTTDPESAVMMSRHGVIQGYNAQILTTSDRYIFGCSVTAEQNDQKQLGPMYARIIESAEYLGINPDDLILLADAGYWSWVNMMIEEQGGPDLLISPWKERKLGKAPESFIILHEVENICWGHGSTIPCVCGAIAAWAQENLQQGEKWLTKNGIVREIMNARLLTEAGRKLYSLRKQTVETTIGNIKTNMNFKRFLMRGLKKVNGEWTLVCLVHNIKKGVKNGLGLFINQKRSGCSPM
jgi:transposase